MSELTELRATPVPAAASGRFVFGNRPVHRLGYGGMKLTGPRLMGPPADREAALAALRRAVELGVDHVETSDHYGPHVVNELIREALHPYPDGLVIATKVGARRTPDGGWAEALAPAELRRAVQDNLDQLGLDVLDVVCLRMPGMGHQPEERSLAEPFEALVRLQEEGLVRHVGVSHVSAAQVAEARSIAPVACVQHDYNLINRVDDDLVDELARDGIPYVAVQGLSYTELFRVRQLTPEQSAVLASIARRAEATPEQVAMAWLLARSPNLLLIPGATSVAQVEDNVAAAALRLDPRDAAQLDRIADLAGAPSPADRPRPARIP
ncbi:oxidoreductase [Geodermatophilus sp. URMC 64]